jgi:tetratricopeptide (TPR) repeat protein
MKLSEYIQQGNQALKESNWEMALQYWSMVYAQVPKHQWAGITLGLALFRLNRFDEAAHYLLDDVELHPDRELAFIYLAKISQAQENWTLNVQQCEIILSRFPNYEWALQLYANALKQVDKLNKAERYFHMDVAQYPQHSRWSYSQLIEIAVEKQQYKLAQKRLEAFSEWFPEDLETQSTYKTLLQTAQRQRSVDYKRARKPPYNRLCFTSANQQEFMYALIPKVASTTIIARLYKQMIGKEPLQGTKHKVLMREFRDKRPYDPTRNDYFTFTIVRNPFTRVLSAYLHTIHRPKAAAKFRPMLGFGPPGVEDVTFGDFLRRIREIPVAEMNGHFCPQWYLLRLHQSAKYDFIGRFESLESDLLAVFRLIGDDDMSRISRRRHATHAGEKLRQCYGDEEQALVAEIYEDDFKYFGYGYDLDLA